LPLEKKRRLANLTYEEIVTKAVHWAMENIGRSTFETLVIPFSSHRNPDIVYTTDSEFILNMRVTRDPDSNVVTMVGVRASVRVKHSTENVAINKEFNDILSLSGISDHIRFGLAGSHASPTWHVERINVALNNRVPSWLDAALEVNVGHMEI
jgi:hypothetical protein